MEERTYTITTLHNLLDYDARKFIVAELALKKIIPAWINKAGTLKLKTILQKYLDIVIQNIQKMDGFINEEKIDSLSISNPVMNAFIEEADEKLAICKDAAIMDACLVASIQAINHFKISTYGTAAAFANTLGMEKQSAIFHEAATNEKKMDDRLTQLAGFEINLSASAPLALPG